MKEEKRIGFKDLTGSLKTLVVFGWICVGVFVLSFGVGFIQGLLLYS